MGVKKVEIINPYRQEHIDMMRQFCFRNHMEDVAKTLQDISSKQDELTYIKNKLASSMIDDYIALIDDHKVTDYCLLHGEKDLRQCFLAFPNIIEKRQTKDRKMVELAVNYAFSLGMEEVFVSPSNQDVFLQNNLENLGFISLGEDEHYVPYVLTSEERMKEKVVS